MKTLYSIVDCVWNHIYEWYQAPKRKSFDFISFWSEVTAQIRWRVFNFLWSIALRHLTRRKKCDCFWLPGTESFPMVYDIIDFLTIIFSRYYTLSINVIIAWLKKDSQSAFHLRLTTRQTSVSVLKIKSIASHQPYKAIR